MPEPIAIYVARSREGADGTFIVTLRYAYKDKPPSLKRRTEMAASLLREVLDRLEADKLVDLGFAEDARRRVRTDKMQA